MAVDKLVDSAQLDADLTSVANAIRTKGGTSAQLAFPSGFVSAIQAIPSGSGLPDGYEQYERAFFSSAQITTNYTPAQNDSVDILFSISVTNRTCWVLSSGTTGNRFTCIAQPSISRGTLVFRNLVVTVTTVSNLNFGTTPHEIKFSPSAVYLDSTKLPDVTQQTANGQLAILGGYADNTNPLEGYIWYMAVRRNNETIHYYVPCVRTSDSTGGMFDIITGTFFAPSQGTIIPEAEIIPDSEALSIIFGGAE